jgi:hypothetical protein
MQFYKPISERYDMTLVQYLTRVLSCRNIIREYILNKCLFLVGGDPRNISTINFLKVITLFGGAHAALIDPLFCRLKSGFSGLVGKIYEEIINKHKTNFSLHLNTPVSSISCSLFEYDSEDRPVSDSLDRCIPKPCSYEKSKFAELLTQSGQIFHSHAVILAVPMASLASIRVAPPLPDRIIKASESCNIGSVNKVWAFVMDVSPDVDLVVRAVNIERYGTTSEESFIRCRDLTFMGYANVCLLSFMSLQLITENDELQRALRKHHPFVRVLKIISSDYQANPWIRNSYFSIRAGTVRLYDEAINLTGAPYEAISNNDDEGEGREEGEEEGQEGQGRNKQRS